MTSHQLLKPVRTLEQARVDSVIATSKAAGSWPLTPGEGPFDEIERQADIYKAALAIHEASTKALCDLAECSRELARYVTCDQEWWAVEIDGSHDDTFSNTFGQMPEAIARAKRADDWLDDGPETTSERAEA